VVVTPPVDAEAGTYVLKLRAESVSDDSVYDLADIKVKVRQVFDLLIEPASSFVTGVAGVWHDTPLTITNLGNGEDIIQLDALVPSGQALEARFDRGTLTLGAGANTTVTMRIRADQDALADAHIIEVTARSSSSTIEPYKVEVTYQIPAFYSVDILTDTGQTDVRFTDAVVGRTYQVTVEVFNLGNSEDTFSMLATSENLDLPSWFSFEDPEVTVAAGGSKTMVVTMTIPTTVLAGTSDFEIRAKSQSANETGILTGTVEVSPDRSVIVSTDNNQASVDPTGGEGAVFTITVNNNGNVQESVTFDVNIPSGWQAPTIDPETVTIAAYGIATVTVTFPPSAVPGSASTNNAVSLKARYGPFDSPMLNLVVEVLKPVVSVDQVTVAAIEPKPDDVVDVTISLKNTGDVAATGVTVILLVDDAEAGRLTGQSIPANGDKDVLITWIVDNQGGDIATLKVRLPDQDLSYTVPETVQIASDEQTLMEKLDDLGFPIILLLGFVVGILVGIVLLMGVRGRYKKRLEAARAAGMAEGLTIADMDKDEEEPEPMDEEDMEGDSEEGSEEEGAEDEDEPEDDEDGDSDVAPVTVQCPKCDTLNSVTTAQRPYEFRCEKCNALLRLSR
jgi:uncharacterized repeat protein (TIGR01451 family)